MWIDGLAVKNSQICHGFFIVGFTDHDRGTCLIRSIRFGIAKLWFLNYYDKFRL
jgi:hypothetical protein